jgi:NarL family two-component system sensor histidine kinase LiaS
MFLLLFRSPAIIIIPLLAIPAATFLSVQGSTDPDFLPVISHVLLFCTLNALTIFFIHLVQQQEQRIVNILIRTEKNSRMLAILKERQRFAQDFHDGIGSHLTSVVMQVDFLQIGIEPKDSLYAELSEIKAGALASIDDMRGSIAFMREDFDVAEQVALLCENMRDRHKIAVKTYGVYHLADLKPEQQIACCRVVQESLSNALKHAQASQITVRCVRYHHVIKLTIEDNGLGFTKEQKDRRNHYGLHNMYHRARQAGGALAIVSELNCGTQVELAIPC